MGWVVAADVVFVCVASFGPSLLDCCCFLVGVTIGGGKSSSFIFSSFLWYLFLLVLRMLQVFVLVFFCYGFCGWMASYV